MLRAAWPSSCSPSYVLADRTLAQMEVGRGALEAAALRDRHEAPQGCDVEDGGGAVVDLS
jgi:hypothetical protein